MDRLYDHGRNLFARGELHWRAKGGSIFAAMLVDGDYQPDTATHRYLSDIPVQSRRGTNGGTDRLTAPPLTLYDPVAGVCDADDVMFTAVPSGPALPYVVIFADGGADELSPLVALLDSVQGMPFVPSGGDVEIVFSNGANRVFKL